MKYINTILLFVLIYSCGSSKKAIQQDSDQSKNTETVTNLEQQQQTDKTTTPAEKNLTKNEVVKDSMTSIKETPNKDTSFHQELSKRTLTEHQLWDELLQKYVSKEGNVDYRGFKKDHEKLLGYIYILQMTHEKFNLKTQRSKSELLAFWINAYNAMTVDLILRNYPVSSIKDIKDPWKQRLWQLGDKWYNLDEIEHQIIRKMGEPRIHFALVCAAVSCPKLYNQAFVSETLDEDLTQLTKAFLADTSKNTISENDIRISKIFSWFAKDFKQDGSLIDFLNQYTDITISDNAKKRFNSYNWALNE